MNRYEEYKDSGFDWIGEVPEHWTSKSFRYCMEVLTDFTANGSFASLAQNVTYQDHGYSRLVRLTDLRENLLNEGIYVSEEAHRYLKKSELFGGELLIANVGAYAGLVTIMPKLDGKMTLGPNMFLVKTTAGCDERFFYYLLSSPCCSEQLKMMAVSSAQPKLNKENIRQLKVVIPPIDEQLRIIAFLDEHTQKVDTLISKKEKLIELLQEEHTAIINQAVTKGLGPNVPMKDSGIEWLGAIPKNWTIKRLRYIGSCQNGVSGDADYFGSGSPFISYKDVYKNNVLPSPPSGLANSTPKDREVYSIEEGDILFTRTSETIEEIGLASTCMNAIKDGVFAGFLIRFRPENGVLYKGFSKYYFRCHIERIFFVKEMNLVTRASLSQELLKRLPVLIPNYEEQVRIAEFLDSINETITNTIHKVQREIELLLEYRTALVSEVVTGKSAVRQEDLVES